MAKHPSQSANNDRTNTDIVHTSSIMARLDIATLASRCALENERFHRGQPSDTRYTYELFRRALVERDDGAWEYLFQQYHGLVERWVRNSAAFEASGEDSRNLVAEAFARFWRAVSPESFERFPSVAALLHYLQMCAGCVVIDVVRARLASRLTSEALFSLPDDTRRAPHESVIDRLNSQQIWRRVAAHLNSEAERVVMFHTFVDGMKSREIYEAHPDLFASVKKIYLIKRNVLDRLRRDQRLRDLLE